MSHAYTIGNRRVRTVNSAAANRNPDNRSEDGGIWDTVDPEPIGTLRKAVNEMDGYRMEERSGVGYSRQATAGSSHDRAQ